MPWVKFSRDFDWARPGFTIAYKQGMHINVTRACASSAAAAGAAAAMARVKDSDDGKKTDGRRPEAATPL